MNRFESKPPIQPAIQQEDERAFKCPCCGCTWFEQVMLRQFNKESTAIIGQDIPTLDYMRVCLLRCIKCNELLEPNLVYSGNDATRQRYNKLLDTLEDK